ncbi:MAG: hypothetical protein HZA51_04655 [Planctomycetes bacterium]|nr:hypothetical protein [Planctomycetota bacterium]
MFTMGVIGIVLATGTIPFEGGPGRPRDGGDRFERLDRNHDGVIDRGEFDRGMEQRREGIARRGPRADGPGTPGMGQMGERIRQRVRERVQEVMRERSSGCPNCPMKRNDGERGGRGMNRQGPGPQAEGRHGGHGHGAFEQPAPPPRGPGAPPSPRDFRSRGPDRDPEARSGERMRDRRIERFFHRFDDDHDGKIDRDEARDTGRARMRHHGEQRRHDDGEPTRRPEHRED